MAKIEERHRQKGKEIARELTDYYAPRVIALVAQALADTEEELIRRIAELEVEMLGVLKAFCEMMSWRVEHHFTLEDVLKLENRITELEEKCQSGPKE